MNCPEHLVLKAFGGRLWIWLYWRDVPKSSIPLRIWLNPFRYEIAFRVGKRIVINREGYLSGTISNLLYAYVRPRLCKWFGIHQRFTFVGGDKQCHHCGIGRDEEVGL
jgi:hypothetical protein